MGVQGRSGHERHHGRRWYWYQPPADSWECFHETRLGAEIDTAGQSWVPGAMMAETRQAVFINKWTKTYTSFPVRFPRHGHIRHPCSYFGFFGQCTCMDTGPLL